MFSISDTREPLATLATLLEVITSRENTATVVDSSPLLRIKHSLPPRTISRVLGIPVSHETVDEVVKKRGAQLVTLYPDALPAALPHTPDEIRSEILEAVVSGHLSYIRDDEISAKPHHRRRINKTLEEAITKYWWLRFFLDQHPEFATVVVPNGRTSNQRAFILAARASERKVLFYEIGRAKSKAIYLGWHRIHDRVKTQQEALSATKSVSPEIALETARDWINRRRKPQSDINQFSRGWQKKNQPTAKPSTGARATFFSSSADEFTALGSEWNLQDWQNQYTAFDAIAALLESQGVSCELRVHPNLANKSRRHFWSEIHKIRSLARAHPNLGVVWPNTPVDSYELVEHSDYIIVARSTIGLEASALGKCVWTTTPTRYDLIADVRKIWKPSDVTPENLSLWKADPTGAARFIHHLLETDVPFAADMVQKNAWNSSTPPWRVRLGNLFIRQPIRHKVHIVMLELFVQLQRRLPEWVLKGR